ncbi:hypothetical protein X975_19575, partial [Stegodyphus mimosarum]
MFITFVMTVNIFLPISAVAYAIDFMPGCVNTTEIDLKKAFKVSMAPRYTKVDFNPEGISTFMIMYQCLNGDKSVEQSGNLRQQEQSKSGPLSTPSLSEAEIQKQVETLKKQGVALTVASCVYKLKLLRFSNLLDYCGKYRGETLHGENVVL